MASLLPRIFCKGVLSLAMLVPGFGQAAEPKIPDHFLPLKEGVRAVLLTPVSGEFRDVQSAEAVGKLCGQLPINSVISAEGGKPRTFTGTFRNVPLRTALFQIAEATQLTLEVVVGDQGQIIIRGRPK